MDRRPHGLWHLSWNCLWLIALCAFTALETTGCDDVDEKIAELRHGMDSAEMTKINQNLRTIVQSAQVFYASKGRYPDSIDDLKAIRHIPRDPWGKEYDYELIEGQPRAICYGKDGVEGGAGENADLFYPPN